MSSATSFPTSDLALPPNSLILVTGSTGFIGSHIVRELLSHGYRVRGTSRTEAKATTSRETTHSNHKNYSTTIVPDISAPNAYAEAIKDVDGVIHVATDTELSSSDPAGTISTARESTVGIMQAALEARPQTVKRVVVTSSSVAATMPRPNERFTIDANTWNDAAEKAVADGIEKGEDLHFFLVYAASKTAAERAAWAFMEKNKPPFVLNTVLPNFNLGTQLEGANVSPTQGAILQSYKGDVQWDFISSQYFVDVVDDARVHVGALLDKSVNGKRLYAFAAPFNGNDVLDVIRKIRPEAKTAANKEDLGRDLSVVDNAAALGLLKKWFGQGGWTTFEASMQEALKGY